MVRRRPLRRRLGVAPAATLWLGVVSTLWPLALGNRERGSLRRIPGSLSPGGGGHEGPPPSSHFANAASRLAEQAKDPSPSKQGASGAKAGFWEHALTKYYNGVVRITAQQGAKDIMKPYLPPQQSTMVGSGFAVTMQLRPGEWFPMSPTGNATPSATGQHDPIFVTNAHVVRNALQVEVELARLSMTPFPAQAVMIYEEFDLALVKLRKPKQFVEFLVSQKEKLDVFCVDKLPIDVKFGKAVMALGYPQATQHLQSTSGTISGIERVNGHVSFQMSAPISPGNSGGPLVTGLGEGELGVVGVNFASSALALSQNVNYAIQTVHVRQILRAWHDQAPTWLAKREATLEQLRAQMRQFGAAEGLLAMQEEILIAPLSLRVAPVGATILPALDLRDSDICQGPLIAKIEEKSLLPRSIEGMFLRKINGVGLDNRGYGRTADALGEGIPPESILPMVEDLGQKTTIEVCKGGKSENHDLTMAWDDKYEAKVDALVQPAWHAFDFEAWAGMLIQPMSLSHLEVVFASRLDVRLCGYLQEEQRQRSRLMVTYIKEGTYASRVVPTGSVVKKINDVEVGTLEEFRKHFVPSRFREFGGLWTMETEAGHRLQVNFADTVAEMAAMQQADPQNNAWMVTPMFLQVVASEAHRKGIEPQVPLLRPRQPQPGAKELQPWSPAIPAQPQQPPMAPVPPHQRQPEQQPQPPAPPPPAGAFPHHLGARRPSTPSLRSAQDATF